jgi:hypothetical protein
LAKIYEKKSSRPTSSQSPINPRSDRKTRLLDRCMRGFAPPRPQKFPYNAALNGPAIFPYRDNSQSEAHAEVFTDFCARQRLSEPRTKFMFICLRVPLQKTLSNAASTVV